MKKKTDRWLATLQWLRRSFPVDSPIRVQSKKMEDCGDTTYSESKRDFRIRINKRKSFQIRLDTIFHEWAHVLTWFGAEQDEEHSGEWGMAYARIYRTFLAWDYGKKKKRAIGPLPGQREFSF